jgi:hypothetical protein
MGTFLLERQSSDMAAIDAIEADVCELVDLAFACDGSLNDVLDQPRTRSDLKTICAVDNFCSRWRVSEEDARKHMGHTINTQPADRPAMRRLESCARKAWRECSLAAATALCSSRPAALTMWSPPCLRSSVAKVT